jgi:hypothetical protein
MAVILKQITIGAAATQFSATSVPCRQIIIQNNAAHTMTIGDSTVTATNGIRIAAGPAGGSINSGPVAVYATNLFDWWVAGTQNDIVDVLYVS